MASNEALMKQAHANWRTWLPWVAAPIAALPLLGVGVSRRMGFFNEVTAGVISLGLVSLSFIGLSRLPRAPVRPGGGKAWKRSPKNFPISGSMVPEEFAASTASGH